MHPILAFMAGGLIGAAVGRSPGSSLPHLGGYPRHLVVAAGDCSRATAPQRLGESLAALIPAHRLLTVAVVVGVPAAIPFVRQRIVATAWCLIVRHRLRVAFSQFISRQPVGLLPFIGMAWPTPVGETSSLSDCVRACPCGTWRDGSTSSPSPAGPRKSPPSASAGNSATVRIEVRRA